ncbi:MAG: hypothetical protein PUF50_06275 [Erysipelotrichaceae bacterium]|nr:hypothetical protein [Erysipelotrichaceae bacterium]
MLMYFGLMFWGICQILYQSIMIFKREVFGQQGYLTLTLPVATWKMVLSKVVVMVIWSWLTGIVVLLSFALFTWSSQILDEVNENLITILQEVMEYINLGPMFYITLFVGVIPSTILSIVLIGFCVSMMNAGRISKGKDAISVVAFLLISYFINYIRGLFINVNPSLLIQFPALYTDNFLIQSWIRIGFDVILCIGFFMSIVYIIDRKVELE